MGLKVYLSEDAEVAARHQLALVLERDPGQQLAASSRY